MAWIELQKPRHLHGRERRPGFRCQYPYQAGLALVASGAAVWVDGPRKQEAEPEPIKKPEAGESNDLGAEDETPEPEREESTDETEDQGDEDPEREYPDPDTFAELELADQKGLIRELGLDEKCDLRKPLEMVLVYGEWARGELEE